MKKILVVSHDAGGANILSSLIKKYSKNFDWISCVAGPAKKIFLKVKIKPLIKFLKNDRKKIDALLQSLRPDLVLIGTSWQSNFENNFKKSAKFFKIKTAAYLDHWVNYRERFGYPENWKINLPDMIFVGDKWAYKIALSKGFPKKILFQVENPYFEEIFRENETIKQNDIKSNNENKIRILYVSQSTTPSHSSYSILMDLIKIVKSLKIEVLPELKIRLHPAERTNKYSHLLKNKKYSNIRKLISISQPNNNLLIKDCLWAHVVVGSNSMALFIAFLIGKKAISYIPWINQTCSLPQKEIKRIKTLDKLLKEISIYKKENNLKIVNNIISRKDLFLKIINKLL